MGGVSSSAEISACGKYRYTLTRKWSEFSDVAWIMLNPSTADAMKDDPTIRRCIGFARDWGYGGILVVNLFPFRATDPAELKGVPDLFGDTTLSLPQRVRGAGRVIAAWGCPRWYFVRDRAAAVTAGMKAAGIFLYAIGRTIGGHPVHPLYMRSDAKPMPFEGATP
jgi:hypothetical protein